MTLRIACGITFGADNAVEFEITEVAGGTFSVRIDKAGVKHGTTVVDTGVRWAHVDMSAVTSIGGYGDLATVLKTALDAGSPNALTYTVTYDASTLGYTIAASAGGISALWFSTVAVAAEGVRARQLLGFSGDDLSFPTVSDVAVFYAINAAMGCKSNPTEVYEPTGVAEGGWTHAGSHFSVASFEAIKFDDFDLYFESKAATFEQDATAATPWTYQHMWEHVRSAEPFIVIDDVDSRVYFLRPEAASFTPDRAVANWDGGFHLKLKCFLAGYA